MTEADRIDELKQIARDLDNDGHYKAAAKVRRAAQLMQSNREAGSSNKQPASNHGD